MTRTLYNNNNNNKKEDKEEDKEEEEILNTNFYSTWQCGSSSNFELHERQTVFTLFLMIFFIFNMRAQFEFTLPFEANVIRSLL